MTQRKTVNLIEIVASVDPVPSGEVAALVSQSEYERTLSVVRARRSCDVVQPAALRSPRRRGRLALALVAAVALALPALALSGRFGDLFGFSHAGTPVEMSAFDPRLATQLKGIGADGNVRLLDRRNGVAFYVARGASGALCLALAMAEAPAPEGIRAATACMPPETADSFPTPELPVWSMTTYMSPVGGPRAGVFVQRVAGFAADGVAEVEVVAEGGSVIASVPVAKNVFAATDLPQVPIAALVARDGDGNVVWRESHKRSVLRRPAEP